MTWVGSAVKIHPAWQCPMWSGATTRLIRNPRPAGPKETMAIRGKSFREIQSRLTRFCIEAGHTDRALYLLLSSGRAIPVNELLAPRNVARLTSSALRYGRPRILHMPPSFNLKIKNNAQLVYSDTFDKTGPARRQLVSAKIGLPSKWRTGSLAREIKARKVLRDSDAASFSIPTLLGYDRRRLTWLVEEFVRTDPRVTPDERSVIFLDQHATSFYTGFARSRPIAAFLRKTGIAPETVQRLLDDAAVPLGRAYSKDTWPVSLTHGDLSTGNMIASDDGRLYVVDWEKFGQGPIAWDLRKLYRNSVDSVRDVLQKTSRGGDIDPTMQMRIVFAIELAVLRRDRDQRLAYLRNHAGMSRSASVRRVQARDSTLRDLIAA